MNAPAIETGESPRGARFIPAQSRFDLGQVMKSMRNIASVSEALRIIGAAVLLASMSLFLLQGWNDGNDIRRYLMLLTQTGLLATGGFLLSHGLKEAKGARLFFGLALVSIPANFTILGALIYSVFQWDGALTTYPAFATWQIGDVASIGITLAGAAVVLLPITAFAYAIMARHSAKALSLQFLALNVLLLLPIRSSVIAGSVALMSIVYALYVVRSLVPKDKALSTGEGRFALATLFIPAGIILFRSMYFYQVDSLMIAMLSLAGFLAARQAAGLRQEGSRIAKALDILSVPLALTVAVATTNAFAPVIADALTAPLFAVVYSGLALDLIRRTDSRRLASAVGVSASLFSSLALIFVVAFEQGALSAFVAIAGGVLMLVAGVALKHRTSSVAGVFTIIAGVLFGFDALQALILASDWIDLAIFGACAIATGSVLDRYGTVIRIRLANLGKSIGKTNDGQGGSVALDD